MKQKLIYIVILVAAASLPAGSRECGKLSCCPLMVKAIPEKIKTVVKMEEIDAVPASPFSRLLFNL
jgi:hypothetical protein